MKIQFLLLFFISLFCGCQIAQKAQINESSTNSDRQKSENKSDNKPLKKIQPKPVDESRFLSVKIKKTISDKKYFLKVNVEYPQFKEAETPQEIELNKYVKKKVDEQIADFNSFLINEKLKEVKVKSRQEFEINLDYKIDYISKSFTSILMNWNGYSGYLNMDYFPSTINFDLRNGKVVEQKNIFEPNIDYLTELSKLSRQILRKTCLSCGCGKGISAGDPLPEELIIAESEIDNSNTAANKIPFGSDWYKGGTEPNEENFNNWSITAEGLKITFGEYQVGPGCIGIIDIVIPFEDLQTILRKDLEFKS